ncbi:DUF3347 domain-containing protein [Pedobacter sp. AW31-3R]|uniref:DUF3347 domain-containing protein n=1 Tax=Pedobacter sp. AW31-3R TaxID=3445781 RepID=UPI003F9FA5E1
MDNYVLIKSNKMNKIFLLVAFVATAFAQTGFSQQEKKSSGLLQSYDNVKDALVADNAAIAATIASEFVQVISDTDEKTINNIARKSLLKHAGLIAASKYLDSQREHLAAVSDDLIIVAKTAKLTVAPVYQMYCPMKKSNWLSSEERVKNPYYDSAMLTCGKVVGTIK